MNESMLSNESYKDWTAIIRAMATKLVCLENRIEELERVHWGKPDNYSGQSKESER